MGSHSRWFVVIMVVVSLVVGFFVGNSRGYHRAQADVKKAQEEAARKAAQQATKATNPFQAVNPVAGIEANPFQKAKDALNPFK